MWFEWRYYSGRHDVKEALGNAELLVFFVSRFIIKRIRKSDSESQHKLLFPGLNICCILLLIMQSVQIDLNKHCELGFFNEALVKLEENLALKI